MHARLCMNVCEREIEIEKDIFYDPYPLFYCMTKAKAADLEANKERLQMRQRQLEEMANALNGVHNETLGMTVSVLV